MKILVMGNNDHRGGLIVHYEYLARFLKRKGFKIMCININDGNQKIFNNKDIIELNIPYSQKKILSKIKKSVKLIICLIKVRLFKPDLFIATGMGYSYISIASFLSSKTFKIHQEVIFDAEINDLRKKINKKFNAIGVQTYSMIPMYKENVNNNSNVNFIPCFTRELKPPSNKQLNTNKTDIIRLAYFGRLAHNKGLVNFIENTFEVFFDNNIVLDIYGKGIEYDNIYKSVKQYGLENKINLKGFYTDNEFPDLISSYGAIILPSTYNEGLPLVILESMYYNKPIFATRMGSIPEIADLNKGIFLSNFDKTQKISFIEFLKLLKGNYFEKVDIRKIYDERFSNVQFEKVWLKMLSNPSKYFN